MSPAPTTTFTAQRHPNARAIGSPSLAGWNWPFKQGPYCTGSSCDDVGPVLASFIHLLHAVEHPGRALYPPVLRRDQIAHSLTCSASSKSLFYCWSFDLLSFSSVYVLMSETGRSSALGKGLALPLCSIVVRFDPGEKKR